MLQPWRCCWLYWKYLGCLQKLLGPNMVGRKWGLQSLFEVHVFEVKATISRGFLVLVWSPELPVWATNGLFPRQNNDMPDFITLKGLWLGQWDQNTKNGGFSGVQVYQWRYTCLGENPLVSNHFPPRNSELCWVCWTCTTTSSQAEMDVALWCWVCLLEGHQEITVECPFTEALPMLWLYTFVLKESFYCFRAEDHLVLVDFLVEARC